MKNIVIKTIATTLFLLILFAGSIFGLLNFCAPLKMGNFYESIGLNESTLDCYNKEYKNSDDINEIFFMFNKSVKLNADEYIKIYSQKMLKHKHFEEFEEFLNSKSPTELLLQNEQNRIEKKYVESLYKTKLTTQAKNYAFKLLASATFDDDFVFAVDGLPDTIVFNSEEKVNIKNAYNSFKGYFEGCTSGSLSKGVAAVRLTEMLNVITRFDTNDIYDVDFESYRNEIKLWDIKIVRI